MDRIRQLKKVYSECGVVSALDNSIENLSAELKGIRDKAKKSHKEIQEIAKENRKVYDDLILFSKEIDKINKEQEQAFDNFLKFKKEFSEVNDDLKKKLDSIALLKSQLGDNRKEEERNKEFIKKKTLAKLSKAVEEKIKSKKKLTTEDLLAYQQSG